MEAFSAIGVFYATLLGLLWGGVAFWWAIPIALVVQVAYLQAVRDD